VALTLSKKTSSSAFALSLAGGILIILGSIVSLLFFAHFWSSTHDRMGGMMGNGMMGGSMMGGMVSNWFLSIPIVAGILVVIGATMLKFRPQQTTLLGIIIIVFSVVGFTGMGISFIGSILGIIGGALALSRR
jgi:hypothetical protein